MPNKYEIATQRLIQQIQNLNLPAEFHARYDMVQTVRDFRRAFSDPMVRDGILLQKYEQARMAQERYSAGFCGIASYTWNHLFRMPNGDEIWRLKQYRNSENTGYNHVWLENVYDGEILDLTYDQFGDVGVFPYDKLGGKFVDSNFEFCRAYTFAERAGFGDLSQIVFENMLHKLAQYVPRR